MFQTDKEVIVDSLSEVVYKMEKSYIIGPNDYLEVKVYTNKGERLVDPNNEMAKQLATSNAGPEGQTTTDGEAKYLVESNGEVRLPLLGFIKVQGYTLHKLDSVLQTRYSDFYEDAFVMSKVVNRRVFILGNSGGKNGVTGMVIPLQNESMSVIEVITQAGGMDYMAKANRIRLLRGDLKNPNVYLIDLSTIEGVKKSHLTVQPNDIIYVERQRRALSQVLTEVTPLIMLTNTVLLLILALKH